MAKEKRFIEDFNEEFNESEPEEENLKSENEFKNLKETGNDSELEKEFEESEEEEDIPNIFEDNFGSFSPRFRSRTSSFSASLESEPARNLETGLQEVPSQEQTPRAEEAETPAMYNAPQYGSGYDAAAYESIRSSERVDVTGEASTANLGREINMKRWQETAMGYPLNSGSIQDQGDNYLRAPEKQKEARGLPFERGAQRRNMGWKEEY